MQNSGKDPLQPLGLFLPHRSPGGPEPSTHCSRPAGHPSSQGDHSALTLGQTPAPTSMQSWMWCPGGHLLYSERLLSRGLRDELVTEHQCKQFGGWGHLRLWHWATRTQPSRSGLSDCQSCHLSQPSSSPALHCLGFHSGVTGSLQRLQVLWFATHFFPFSKLSWCYQLNQD